MNRPITRSGRAAPRLSALAATAALAGCAMVSPYDHLALEPDKAGDDENRAPPGLRLAGSAEEGLRAADQMRLTYFRNLKSTALVRNWTGGTASVLGGWAIYNATRTTDAGTDAVKDRSAALAATFASLFSLRELFVNPRQEAVYASGYRSLTCLMLQSAPLLMTEGAPDADIDRLRSNLRSLSTTVDQTHEQVAVIRAEADSAAAADGADTKDRNRPLARRLRDADKALAQSRTALSDGSTLLRTIEHAGRDIKVRAGLIVAAVNEQVQAAQPQPRNGTDVFNDAHAIAEGVLNVGADTAADVAPDAADATEAPQSTLGAPWWRDGLWLAGPMSAAADRMDDLFAQAAPRQPAPGGARKPTTDNRRPPTEAERMRAVERAVAALHDDAERRCRIDGASSCASRLAVLTERLYAARRPVVQELQNFRRRTRTALQTPECAELAPLRLVPNDVLYLRAGASATYLVTQRDPGNPMVVLQGAQEGPTGATLTFTAVEGSTPSRFKAVVTVGQQAERRTLRIVASDSIGKAYLSVPIVVGGGVAKRDAAARGDAPASAGAGG